MCIRDSFISIGSLPSGVYPFENSLTSVGTVPTSLRNRKLKWETTEQWNLGLDLGFLDERDVYKRQIQARNSIITVRKTDSR